MFSHCSTNKVTYSIKNINNTQTSSVANNTVTTDKKPSKKKRKKTELSDSSVSQPNSSIDNTSLNANANEPESTLCYIVNSVLVHVYVFYLSFVKYTEQRNILKISLNWRNLYPRIYQKYSPTNVLQYLT
jgi:hypothetical protein